MTLKRPKELFAEACNLTVAPMSEQVTLKSAIAFCREYRLEYGLERGEDRQHAFWIMPMANNSWFICVEDNDLKSAIHQAVAAAYSTLHSGRETKVVDISHFRK